MKIQINKIRLIIYLAVMTASLVFSSFYGGPVSYAWLYAIVLLLPVSLLYIFLNYRFLRIYQEIEVHKVVRNEDHAYKALIENAGILPIHRMRILLFSDRCNLYEIEEGSEISLDVLEKKELNSGISCRYAGSYYVGIERVAFSDPFFIYTIEFPVPYSFRAVVSPQITDLANAALDLENLVNSQGLKSYIQKENTPGSDLRPYRRGDSIRSVNWKVSARLSELTVRVPDRMEKRRVTILMQAANVPDNHQDVEYLKLRDYFLEFAVSAAWHFAEQGVPVRLIYPAGKVSESIVDSYGSFMDFYGIVADGIFYSSAEEFEKLKCMADDRRSNVYDDGTWILIREDPGPGESHFIICD